MGGPSRRSHGGFVRKLVWCGRRSFSFASEHEPVRDGHIRVVVGNAESSEEALFQLEPNYLKHPLLEKLLKLTGEEYGYSYKGALRIACDVQLFRYILQLLSSGNPAAHYMDLSDLIYQFSNITSS